MIKNFYKLASLALVIGLSLSSCSKDEKPSGGGEEEGAFSHGMFITNEGGFMKDNASIDFVGKDGKVQKGIFKSVNNIPLGDILQSMKIADGNAYLAVNNSGKVDVVDAETFEYKGTIHVDKPRFTEVANGKAYISQWGESGAVTVIDTKTLDKTKTINVGNGPEGILSVGNEIWVANNGGYTVDNTISVINTSTDEVIKTITLIGEKPVQLTTDAKGYVWVLCSGNILYDASWKPIGHTPSYLVRINPTTKGIMKEIELSKTAHPIRLAINSAANKLYYGGSSGVYEISTNADVAPSAALISGYFYGMNVNSQSKIYTTTASYTGNSTVNVYDSSGKITTIESGIGTNGVVFTN